jgi:CAAD domains of cyanobacterial aminoacyl-tRNA synthetase
MKSNIIRDDREISMKTESFPTEMSDDTESIAVENNPPTEIYKMNTNTLLDLPDPIDPIDPMTIADESIANQIEPMTIADESIVNPAVVGQSTQAEVTAFVENAKSAATEFFNNNRPLFTTLGWIALAIVGAKFVFAALGTIDDIPLVTPILKIVGLVSVVRFSWRYLIREHDRQELVEILDRTKVEILGNRQSIS